MGSVCRHRRGPTLPQLLCFTFVQAAESNHFLRFQFNWCNNRGGNGLVDPYFFFYIKNIGFPYLLILLALLKRKPKELEAPAQGKKRRRCVRTGSSPAARF